MGVIAVGSPEQRTRYLEMACRDGIESGQKTDGLDEVCIGVLLRA